MNRPALDSTGGVDALIGAWLRMIRDQRELSQADIAAKMTALGHRWGKPQVSALENGRRNLSLTETADLCRILGVPLEALLITHFTEVGDDTIVRASVLGGGPKDRWTGSLGPEADAALHAEQLRRIEENIWRSIMGGHPTEDQRAALERISGDLFGEDLLLARNQITLDVVDRHERAGDDYDFARIRGHATRRIIKTIKDHIEEHGGLE